MGTAPISKECQPLEELAPTNRRDSPPPEAGGAAHCRVRPAARTVVTVIPTTVAMQSQVYRVRMALSARNQLRGKVTDVTLGDVMAHVTVQVGDNEIESVITRRSAEEMNLKAGDSVTVVVKSTEVMIQK